MKLEALLKLLSNPLVEPPVPVTCISFFQSASVELATALLKNLHLLFAGIKRSTVTLPVMYEQVVQLDLFTVAVPVAFDTNVRLPPVASVPAVGVIDPTMRKALPNVMVLPVLFIVSLFNTLVVPGVV
jgi:hypothetical protein